MHANSWRQKGIMFSINYIATAIKTFS